MSWSEVKKINSDMKKSLDTLIKEQFNTNNSNVSTVKNDLTTVKSDLAYIKNTQLGTNLNNLLGGSSTSTIDFNNKPLVDKINYILMKNSDFSYTSDGSNITKILSSGYISSSTVGKITEVNRTIGNFTPSNNGIIKVEASTYFEYNTNASSLSNKDKLGIFVRKNGTITQLIFFFFSDYNRYIPKSANLSVKKGETIEFLLGFITGNSEGKSIRCNKLDVKYGYAWSL